MSKKQKRQKQPQQNPAPLRRPDTNEIAVAQVTDKYSEYPSNGLTPVKLAEIFKEADAGDVLRQMELFEEMEEKDPHLFSQLQTRKNAVTGLDFEIIPFSDDPRDKEIADFIEEQINGIESLEDVETDLLDAIGKGFAVSEIMWGYDEGHVVVREIKSRHQKRFFWDSLDDSFKVRTKDAPEGILLPANKFIVHRYKARSGHTSRAASSGSLPGCTYSKTTISRTGSALPRSTAYRFAWASMRPGRARRTRSPSCKPSSRSARTRRALSRTAHRSTSSPRRRRQALTCTNASPDIATSKSPRQSSGRRSPLTLAAEATPRARRTTTSGTT